MKATASSIEATSTLAEEAAAALCLLSMKSAFSVEPSNNYHDSNNNNVLVAHTPPNTNQLPMPLSTPRDSQFLSPLQCYIRQHCVEFFVVENAGNGKDSWVAKGRQTPIKPGRIGIRCVYCKHASKRATQSACFPNGIDKIYSAGSMIQCRHMPNCTHMPTNVRETLARLKRKGSGSSGAKMQKYWEQSARELGFVDKDTGIRFSPSVSTPMEDVMNYDCCETNPHSSITIKPVHRPRIVTPVDFSIGNNSHPDLRGAALVTVADRGLVQDHVFLAFAQMEPTILTIDEKMGPWKDRMCGEKGLRCRHCRGQVISGKSNGKWFPSSSTNLGQTTTMNSIVKHTSICPNTPQEVKGAMTSLLHLSNDSTEVKEKKKYGSRKEFFRRVYGRMTGVYDPLSSLFSPIEVESDDDDDDSYVEEQDEVVAGSKRSRAPSASDVAGRKRVNA